MDISSPNIYFVAVFLAAVAVALIIAKGYASSGPRRDALSSLAVSMGLSFEQGGMDADILARTGLGIFNRGYGRNVSNLIVVRGQGPELRFFDYHYTTGGKNRQAHYLTAALCDLETQKVPVFELRPNNFYFKFLSLLGFKGLTLPFSPQFSANYRLKGPSGTEVLAFFDTGVAAYFEQHPGWRVVSSGRFLALFKAMRRVKPEEYQNFIEETRLAVSFLAKS